MFSNSLSLFINISVIFSYIDYLFCVQNNLHELWSLLNFLLPEIFSSAETFDEWFQISGENDQQEVVQQLHKVVCFFFPLLLICFPSVNCDVFVRFSGHFFLGG